MSRPLLALLGLCLVAPLTRATEPDAGISAALAVQKAMLTARTQMQQGQHRDAVDILEGQLYRIDGNAKYLALLRDAYIGYLQELQLAGKDTERIDTIRRRLKHLDPSSASETPETPVPPPPTPVTVEAPTGPKPPAPEAAHTETPSAPPVPTSVRGQSDDRDPPEGKRLIEQAEEAFRQNRYCEACRLFDRACLCEGGCGCVSGERHGYCKLYAVVDALKQERLGGKTATELETEVRAAMRLAPKLEPHGQAVLKRLQNLRPAAAVGNAPAGWQVIETANCRVLHRDQADLAGQVAKLAEESRGKAFVTWHGQKNADWTPRCDLYLHRTGSDYAEATKKPAASPGHATTRSQGTKVVARQIDLRADDLSLLGSTLPHEMTHVVLTDLFADAPLPRWADEGMAVQAESRAMIERYQRGLPKCQQDGHLQPLDRLLASTEYADARTITAFYVQSVSLVDYLVRLKDEKTFAICVRQAGRYGWDKALEREYGIRGVADLQVRWEKHALGGLALRNP